MGRRVLLPLLVFGLLTVCAVLIPVGDAIAQTRTQQLQVQRAGSVDQILQRAYTAVERGESAALERYLERFHDTYGESVIVVDGAGDVVASVGAIAPGDVAAVTMAALRGVPQWTLPTVYPWSGDTEYVAEPITADGNAAAGAVVLEIDQSAARSAIAWDWLLVAAVGLALLAALLAASVSWTRWVLRPVRALDAAANALAEHRGFEPAHASGPPELRRLAGSFERMARNVEDALEQQRGLVADASHQLRNPLAAIRLRIDALPRDGDPAELAAVEHDLDRLERTVDRMLALANAEHRANAGASGRPDGHGPDSPADCVASASALVEPHRAALAAAGIAVEVFGREERVACRGADLEEMVEIILDNARKYTPRGTAVRAGLVRQHGLVTLVVTDSGAGLSEADLARVGTRFWRAAAHSGKPGTGLGYAIVEQLARANRATVQVDRAPEGGLRTRVRFRAA